MNYTSLQKNILYCMIIFTGLIVPFSCRKKGKKTINTTTNYVVSLRVPGSANESADYLLTTKSINSGEITAEGTGIEQLGWCYLVKTGNTILSYSYDGNTCTGYRFNEDGQLEEKGGFAFEAADCFSEVDENTLVVAGAPWGGGSLDCILQLVDANAVSVKSEKITPLYTIPGATTDTLNKWPTTLLVRGDKLFVSFYPLDGASWETPITDTAYVSVYSYPGLELLSTAKDTRTGPIGAYGNQPSMFIDEHGDIYTISPVSYSAGYTEADKKSGILRIKNGETTFDNNYFYDVESASGYKMILGAYVGNGKAICRGVANTETTSDIWASYTVTKPIHKLFLIDLIHKTTTEISGVPLHGGQYKTPILVENGKAYFSINDGTEAYIYEIDPTTASGIKGAKLKGKEVQAIYGN